MKTIMNVTRMRPPILIRWMSVMCWKIQDAARTVSAVAVMCGISNVTACFP
jgi:hypothetical protein